ncbi:MAG: DUF4136 domain-containing protein [Thermodesulfobacteriota bacterium]
MARLRPTLRRLAGHAVLGVALAACASTARVRDATAPAVDVSAYRTYEWATAAPVIEADAERERDAAVLEITIRDAVDRQLAAKGYRRAEGASPDFLVDFGVRLEEKSTDTFGEYIAYRDRGGHQGLGSAFVFGYEEGTLLLEVTDARSRARAWSGAQRTVLDDGQDVAKLERAVDELLAGFPAAGAEPAEGAAGAESEAAPAAKPKPKLVDLDRYISVPEP